ncbi:MAG: hypothetical protein QE485_10700 [Acidovorax sp.]|uniref:hypothetical protein n=1 Tax=Acidovorax sp. TaxID=1872122 RepID=UPI002620CEC1|nr:hypothetical protein [Acidovorax sp.]MDH4417684.1 hypothetical protein [Acidovorax sp.]
MGDALKRHLDAIPLSIADPAFHVCLTNAAGNDELVANFRRLRGLEQINNHFAREFIGWVHEFVFSRLDDLTLAQLRAQGVSHG